MLGVELSSRCKRSWHPGHRSETVRVLAGRGTRHSRLGECLSCRDPGRERWWRFTVPSNPGGMRRLHRKRWGLGHPRWLARVSALQTAHVRGHLQNNRMTLQIVSIPCISDIQTAIKTIVTTKTGAASIANVVSIRSSRATTVLHNWLRSNFIPTTYRQSQPLIAT